MTISTCSSASKPTPPILNHPSQKNVGIPTLVKDPVRAAGLFKMAAVQGHTPALAALGRAYVEGIGVEVDGEALGFASDDLRDDPACCLTACTSCGYMTRNHPASIPG